MVVDIKEVSAELYSYSMVMHEDKKGFYSEFSLKQNVINKNVTISFLASFIVANRFSNSIVMISFPDTRPISATGKLAADTIANVGSVTGAVFLVSVIPVILFSKFSFLFNALDLF